MTAPIATGRSESGRAGFAPAGKSAGFARRTSNSGGNSYELVRSASERRTRQKIRQRFSGSLAELIAIIDEEIDFIRKDEHLISKPGS